MISSPNIALLTSGFKPSDVANLRPTFIVSEMRVANKLWKDNLKSALALNHNDLVGAGTCPYTGVDWVATSPSDYVTLQTDGLGHWWVKGNGATALHTVNQYSQLGTDPITLGYAFKSASINMSMGGVGFNTAQSLRHALALSSKWFFNGFAADWDTGVASDLLDHTHVVRATTTGGISTIKWLLDQTEYMGNTSNVLGPYTNANFSILIRNVDFGSLSNLYGFIPYFGNLTDTQRDSLQQYLRNLMP